MRRCFGILPIAICILGTFSSAARAAEPAPAPAWTVVPLATPTNFAPGDHVGDYNYQARIVNTGGAGTDGTPITIRDELPPGIEVEGVEMSLRTESSFNAHRDYGVSGEGFCVVSSAGGSQIVTCTISEALPEAVEPAVVQPGDERSVLIKVFTPSSVPEGTTLENRIEVEGGGAQKAAADLRNEASQQPASGGLAFSRQQVIEADGLPFASAGAHPYQFVSTFSVNTKPPTLKSPNSPPAVPAPGDLKDIEVALPPGFIGSPTAAPQCSLQDFNTPGPGSTGQHPFNSCPNSSAVGMVLVHLVAEGAENGRLAVPIYNLVPPPGVPAQLGIQILTVPFYIDAEVRPGPNGEDLQIVGALHSLSEAKRVIAATVILWGTPADPGHDPVRGSCLAGLEWTAISFGNCPAGLPSAPKPFLRLPTNCASPLSFLTSIDTWSFPGSFFSAPSVSPLLTGCSAVPFDPTIPAFRPTSEVTDSPTGLNVDVHVPQRSHEEPTMPGEADLKDVSVSLPPGLVLNPSSANGLSSCSAAQIGLGSAAAPECPDSSRVGRATVETPLLDHPLPGSVYVASPFENPFNSLLAVYIVVNDPVSGVIVKIPSKVTPDPVTGQLTATVGSAPQVPFEDFRLEFFGGDNAALRSPPTCGPYSTTAVLTPWSAPESGPPAVVSDSYSLNRAPEGSCPTSPGAMPNSPAFTAGTLTPSAGAYSPFVIHMARNDGSQEFSAVTVTPPLGLIGKLAGISYCSDSDLAAAAAKSGRSEQSNPSCPAASQVGTVNVGAGAGPKPYYVQGKAYMAGPYKGAPLSIAIVTPATAGPYDLGTVVVRAALRIDPFTTQITADSDPIPQLLQGIPLDVRSIDVRLDRPGFTLNPTSCDVSSVQGHETSVLGSAALLQSRFQVGGCKSLAFKPKLQLTLKGSTKHAGHPALKAVLTYPTKGAYANIARAQVNLPHSEFIDQANLNKTCTKPVLLEGKCPATSIYGKAKAWTPLLDKPLEGPVYLVGGFGYKLPALVAELDGQIRVLLAGKVDSGPNHGIRSTFEAVPDAPVEKFVLEMKGGPKYSLLENSENLCDRPQNAIARFSAQNGKVETSKPKIGNDCGKKKHKSKGKKGRHGKS